MNILKIYVLRYRYKKDAANKQEKYNLNHEKVKLLFYYILVHVLIPCILSLNISWLESCVKKSTVYLQEILTLFTNITILFIGREKQKYGNEYCLDRIGKRFSFLLII